MSPDPIKELKKAPWWVPAAGFLFVLWCVNWIFVKAGYSPFLYCWSFYLVPFFSAYYQIVIIALLIWFGFVAYRRQWLQAFGAGLVVTAVIGLPEFWKTAVGLGGTCQ
jgi:apolipoprotein N-acyltransferase